MPENVNHVPCVVVVQVTEAVPACTVGDMIMIYLEQ